MIKQVSLGNESYDIVIEKGVLSRVGRELDLARRVLVVTDSGVPAVYAKTVAAAAKQAEILCIPAGEASKCIDVWQELLCRMLAHGMTRKDCVVAVGGGVVGDLAAFAASAFMRGIDFYNIPTTLLSQVDSSVGGKCGVDLCGVKNVVGSFYQPKKVLIDPDVLQTLPLRERAAGLAEAIKMAASCDAALFAQIEQSTAFEADLPEIIACAIEIKKSVVEKDPKEGDLRRVLNFGHTIGHAIESAAAGKLLHGECVAIGMLPMCAPSVRARLRAVLEKYGLPTKADVAPEELLAYLKHDKKAAGDGVCAVYVPQIGSFELQMTTPQALVERFGGSV